MTKSNCCQADVRMICTGTTEYHVCAKCKNTVVSDAQKKEIVKLMTNTDFLAHYKYDLGQGNPYGSDDIMRMLQAKYTERDQAVAKAREEQKEKDAKICENMKPIYTSNFNGEATQSEIEAVIAKAIRNQSI